MVLIKITPSDFLQLGLSSAGFSDDRQKNVGAVTNMKRFRASYGLSPDSCASIFHDLQVAENDVTIMKKPQPFYFLMTLHWLWFYKTEVALAGLFNRKESTVRCVIKKYVLALQMLASRKVISILLKKCTLTASVI